jgi:hypothetical protein
MTGGDRSPPLWIPISVAVVGVVGAAVCVALLFGWTGGMW